LRKSFPSARSATQIDELLALKPDLAIVASPPKFHAAQTNALLAAGAHVLCEKPMAAAVVEAESMIAAAKAARRVLAIGLFRRFFPALQTVKALVTGGHLGAARSFLISEGGVFNWPAASASFFQKAHAQGGVLLDVGVHVLDLVHWWFGAPAELSYEDDAMGNLEANCRVTMKFPAGINGTVRLSRDTRMSNRYVIEFERGTVTWKLGEANRLDVQFKDSPATLRGELWRKAPEATYHQSFVNQLLNVAAAARGEGGPLVAGEEGIQSLRLVEKCYRLRKLMEMPWLTSKEAEQAAHKLTMGA
jgi:predicted dehydrogenase